MKENNHTEFKEKLTTELDLEKVVVAFLNSPEGGFIYIGIADNQKVIGVADLDGHMLKIKDRIKNNILPSAMGLFDIVHEVKEGKDIIKIIVASGSEKPYFKKKYGMTEKGCYMRIGSSTEPMPQAMIDKLFSTRVLNSIRLIRSYHQDLTFNILKIYYEGTGLSLNDNFKSNLELLTPNGDYNLVAYLFSDKNRVSIRVAKYDGKTREKLIENTDFGGTSLLRSLEQVLDRIDVENKNLTKLTGAATREDRQLWHKDSLREVIVNAFVHNDYTRELAPKIEFFDDRIEITSYGPIPAQLSEGDFFKGFSVPRNQEIMRIFKDLNKVEHLGSGIPRVLAFYKKDCFSFHENFVRVTLPIFPRIYHTINKASSEIGNKILSELFLEVDGLAIRELETRLSIDRRKLKYELSKLLEQKLAKLEGKGAGARWKTY